MFAKLNDATVLSCSVEMPRVGAWRAEVVVDGDAPPKDPLTLTLGTVALKGTTFRSGGFAGTSYVLMVGGAGGLRTVVDARHYLNGPARVPVSQTISDAGEALAASADADALGATIASWSRAATTAGAAIDELAGALGAAWRVLDDGTVWFGVETWPDAGIQTKDYFRTDVFPSEGAVELAMEAPTLRPGTTFLGQRVGRVRHEVTPGGIRTLAWQET